TGFMRRFDGAPSLRFLQAARAAGCQTSLDLIAPGEDGLALVEPLLPFVDYFMPSIEEARVLSGMEDPVEAARFFLDRGAGTVAVTLGADGSVVADAGGTILRIPAFAVPVVDTTGCGDAYVAGMITGLAQGMDLEAAARLATAASGLVATGLGSDAGIIDLGDTLQRMQDLEVRR
ncbi:carbohydrate kinase family protein, partial [Geminicoccus flavidas]|uniref:carbohydrate kinase family protein n=1 Tax=Geminicoccus flavidas TaxID=2506407 RepID=UPI00190F50B5